MNRNTQSISRIVINSLNNQSLYSNRYNSSNKNISGSVIELYSWGSGWSGQLGLGRNILEQYTPKKIEFEDNQQLKSTDKIKTGSYHALLIKENQLYSWGQNSFGQLGLNDTLDRFTPTLNNQINNSGHGDSSGGNVIKYLNGECGAFHSIVSVYDNLNGQYKTFSFGWNKRLQCGHKDIGSGSGSDIKISKDLEYIKNPKEISILNNQKIKSISCGFDFSVVVGEDNVLYIFGMNDRGQCDASSNDSLVDGVSIRGIKIKKVSSGWGHTLLLCEDGELYSWGSNQHGQCGVGTKDIRSQFSKINFPDPSLKVLDISCGSCASSAILSDNNVYIWGSAGDGKLGLGSTHKDDVLKPVLLDTLYDQEKNSICSISFGSDHCIALPYNSNNGSTSKSFYGWGFGQHGCIGLGSDNLNVFSSPIKNNYFNNNDFNSIISVQSSLDTTFALVNKSNNK